ARENALVDKVIENATMEIPEAMVKEQSRQMLQDFAQRMQMQGLSMEQYMQYTGMNVEQMLEQMQPQALKRIQTRLVLEAIAAAETIEVTEEDIDKELTNMASMYQMEVDKLKEAMGDAEKESIKADLAVQKAVDLIADSAK
ncbi:MAG: trigger factor, partial [Lachnospiraceae bacterium]